MHAASDNGLATTLIVFFKAPARSKRRLSAEIGELATLTAAYLWDCVIEDVEAWPGSVVFAPAEREDAAWLSAQAGAPVATVLQRGENLGARINHVDRSLRRAGKTRTIFVGTDCPAMRPDYLAAASGLLDDFDVVLGPASDGGVVLMGSRVAWPSLQRLPWSTSGLHTALVSACVTSGLSVAELEPRDDVDTADALVAAGRSLAGDARPARRALRAWLLEPGAPWARRS